MKIAHIIKRLDKYIERIEYYETINSTHKYLQDSNIYHKSNTLVIASNQSNSIGKYNKKYYSYQDCGLYMSLLIKNVHEINKLPFIMGVSIVESIKELYGIKVDLKWVNDVYLNNKKLAGILVSQSNDDAIISVGLNLFRPISNYDKDIIDQVIPLFEERKDINIDYLIIRIIELFFKYYNDDVDIIKKYKQYLFIINHYINYNNQVLLVKDISEEGALITLTLDKKEFIINSGSIKLLNNYEDKTNN
ncbi:MAG: biotin--[acetyl-CoA-carboxylase] ligase [Bacilli bacterium]|jgi:BirA family biotin operon repressor/biotin-[acetyl-CoA-carboxylase] ligase|nr:biotin--[acetyl-CoA-carboxylase] ligase [Bacilli bacterium]